MAKWYAVQESREDDWGTGSYDYEEAVRMLKEQGHGLIAVIDEGSNPSEAVCVEEIEFDSLDDDTEYYYWVDLYSTESFTLYKGRLDENGEKDRDAEEEILSCRYENINVNPLPDDDEEREENWRKIDSYIEKELGFLPDYEVN